MCLWVFRVCGVCLPSPKGCDEMGVRVKLDEVCVDSGAFREKDPVCDGSRRPRP